MARIYISFLWHMHQPFYKDLVTRRYRMPWTRLHALKDYYGMVHALRDFPAIRQTFNLVPSMVVQLLEYARGEAVDPLLEVCRIPAEDLNESQALFLVRNGFYATEKLIHRFPRYTELLDLWEESGRNAERTRRAMGVPGLRDLQILSQLAWFEESYLQEDPEVVALLAKGRSFSPADQELTFRKHDEILNRVIPIYREYAAAGRIEISTTPFYHPILPLLCDSNIAAVAHPYVPLPSRFRYPDDARVQLRRARQYMKEEFGQEPHGLWPSEGSVSDEALGIAASEGFRWAATDSGVLERSLGHGLSAEALYKPYLWQRDGGAVHMLFRDHELSDRIGFVYSKMSASEAAEDFIRRIHDNCRPMLSAGRDVVVPVILDGENAWEYYDRNGRPFLRELYQRITTDHDMEAIPVSEAIQRLEPVSLSHIHPGSWINANFDIWIGADEDNRAWEYLLRARRTYEQTGEEIPEARRQTAFEELLIAEGSDWCWWYGPEHHSNQREEFDALYREHLANVYRLLGKTPPDELSQPILRAQVEPVVDLPTGRIRPVLDGEISSYFEWLGAGLYEADTRQGSMHGQQTLLPELRFGSDGASLFLLVRFQRGVDLGPLQARLTLENPNQQGKSCVATFVFRGGEAVVEDSGGLAVECRMGRVLEIAVSLAPPLAIVPERVVRFQFSLWVDGLPADTAPRYGWLEFPI